MDFSIHRLLSNMLWLWTAMYNVQFSYNIYIVYIQRGRKSVAMAIIMLSTDVVFIFIFWFLDAVTMVAVVFFSGIAGSDADNVDKGNH